MLPIPLVEKLADVAVDDYKIILESSDEHRFSTMAAPYAPQNFNSHLEVGADVSRIDNILNPKNAPVKSIFESAGESGLKVTAPTYARQNFDYRNGEGADRPASSSCNRVQLVHDVINEAIAPVKPIFESAAETLDWRTAIQTATSFADIEDAFAAAFGPLVVRKFVDGEIDDLEKKLQELRKKAAKYLATGGAGEIRGDKTTAFLNDNSPVELQYAVMEADKLVTSHSDEMLANPEFAQDLQPRDRTRAGMTLQVDIMANKLNPERLGASTSVSTGAPIIGQDRVVESGNGRTIAIRKAYAAGAKGREYKQWLIDNAEDFGIPAKEIEAMQRPVLVRIRLTEIDRAEFARRANEDEIAQMAPAELARADAAKLTDDDLALFRPSEDGNIGAATNREFIAKFFDRMGATAATGYMTPDGGYTKQIIDRIQAAIFQKAYQDDFLLGLMAEEADPRIKNILSAMTIAAGEFARAKAIDPTLMGIDIPKHVIEAARLIKHAKENNLAVEQVLAQMGLFEDIPEATKQIALFIHQNIRSAKRIGAVLKESARQLRQMLIDDRSEKLIETDAPPPTVAEIVGRAIEKEKETRASSLFEAAKEFDWRGAIGGAAGFDDIESVFRRLFIISGGRATEKQKEDYQQNGTKAKAFKNWFGDWESAAKATALRTMKPTEIDPYLLGDPANKQDIRDNAEAEYGKLKNIKAKTTDGKEVEFPVSSFKETKQHNANVRAMQIIPYLPKLINEAIPLWSNENTDKEKPNIIAYHHYGIKGDFGGRQAYIRIVIRQDSRNNWYYDNDATSVEAIDDKKAAPSVAQPDQEPNPGEVPERLSDNRLYQWFQNVKAENISKVVKADGSPQDTYNISPIVVYHGTAHGGFDKFDKEKADDRAVFGPGFYFTESKAYADEYQKKGAVHEIEQPLSKTLLGKIGRWIDSKEFDRLWREDMGVKSELVALAKAWDAAKEDPSILGNYLASNKAETVRRKFNLTRRKVGAGETKACYLNIRNPFNSDPDPERGDAPELDRSEAERLVGIARSMGFEGDMPSSMFSPGITPDHMLQAFERFEQVVSVVTPEGADTSVSRLMSAKEINEVLRRAGYDGRTHTAGSSPETSHRVWIVFEPNQIKSIDNEGGFTDSDNIYETARNKDNFLENDAGLVSFPAGAVARDNQSDATFTLNQETLARRDNASAYRIRGLMQGPRSYDSHWIYRRDNEALFRDMAKEPDRYDWRGAIQTAVSYEDIEAVFRELFPVLAVRQSFADGEPVPPEVLKDYPDLLEKIKEDLLAYIRNFPDFILESEQAGKSREQIRKFLEGIKPENIKALKLGSHDAYLEVLKALVAKLFPEGAEYTFRKTDDGAATDYEHFLKDRVRENYIQTIGDTIKRSDITLELKEDGKDKEYFIKKYFDQDIQKDVWDLVIAHDKEVRTKFARTGKSAQRYIEGQVLKRRPDHEASRSGTPDGNQEIASTQTGNTVDT